MHYCLHNFPLRRRHCLEHSPQKKELPQLGAASSPGPRTSCYRSHYYSLLFICDEYSARCSFFIASLKNSATTCNRWCSTRFFADRMGWTEVDVIIDRVVDVSRPWYRLQSLTTLLVTCGSYNEPQKKDFEKVQTWKYKNAESHNILLICTIERTWTILLYEKLY